MKFFNISTQIPHFGKCLAVRLRKNFYGVLLIPKGGKSTKSKMGSLNFLYFQHKETHLKVKECAICGLVFKSAKAMKQHLSTLHGENSAVAELPTSSKIQCTLCNSTDFSGGSIEDHQCQVEMKMEIVESG